MKRGIPFSIVFPRTKSGGRVEVMPVTVLGSLKRWRKLFFPATEVHRFLIKPLL